MIAWFLAAAATATTAVKVLVITVAVSLTSLAVVIPVAVINGPIAHPAHPSGAPASSSSSVNPPFGSATSATPSRSGTSPLGAPVASPSPLDPSPVSPSLPPQAPTSMTPSPTAPAVVAAASTAPLGLALIASAGDWADVAWSAPANTGTQPLEGYALFASRDGGTSWVLSGTVPSGQLTYQYGSLLSTTSYVFAAQAITTAGTSELSNRAAHETVVFAPGVVGSLVMADRGCSRESCGGQMTIKPPAYAGVGTMFYEVGYSVDAGATWVFVDGNPWPSPGSNEIQFTTGPIAPDQQSGILIMVRASTEYGVGTPSTVINF